MPIAADPIFLDALSPPEDAIEREIAEIEGLRRRALSNRDILYRSSTARYLVEKEIPRLIGIVRRIRRMSAREGEMPSTEAWMQRLLGTLHEDARVVRDLVERY